MTKKEKAMELFKQGYNCSQSVYGAFCEDFSLDFNQAMCIASGLGGGVGRLREVCGAVSGMALVLSLKYGNYAPDDHESKAELYKKIQFVAGEFEKANGSIICKNLLKVEKTSPEPEKRTEAFYHKRPCGELVGCAAEILEKFLAND